MFIYGYRPFKISHLADCIHLLTKLFVGNYSPKCALKDTDFRIFVPRIAVAVTANRDVAVAIAVGLWDRNSDRTATQEQTQKYLKNMNLRVILEIVKTFYLW